MKLLYGYDDDVSYWVANQIPRVAALGGFGNCRGVGVVDGQMNLVAGWIWHNHDPNSGVIEFSGASVTPKWMTRAILHDLFAYAFEGINCQMVVTQNEGSNTRLHRQLKAFGFKRHDIPRLYGRFEDAVIWRLTREAWESSRFYIPERGVSNEQESRPASAA